MRFLALFICFIVGFSQFGQASIIFTLSPASQTIVRGNVGQFNLSVRSDVVGGQQVDGLEANVVSSAPNSLFTNASQTLLLNNGAISLSPPGQAFISNFLSGGFLLGTTDTLFARLFLTTTNVTTTGPFTISLNQLAANSPALAALPVQSAGTVSFTVAVPEPASGILIGLGLMGIFLFRRRMKCLRFNSDPDYVEG